MKAESIMSKTKETKRKTQRKELLMPRKQRQNTKLSMTKSFQVSETEVKTEKYYQNVHREPHMTEQDE